MKRNPLAGLGLFDKSFWRILLPLALPIALQNLLMTSFRLVDTLMIGRLGDVSIAAVGLAGQASFLVELVAFGMASGSAVFIAQYHGAGDLDGIRRTFGATILFGFPFGLIATLVCLLFPEEIMVLFTDDPALIAEGARYLEYACWSYLALAVYQSMCTTLRSTERVRLPMISSGICAVANAALNYLFIFGCPGLEPMGVAGAGLATAITSLMNPLIIYVVSLVQRNILIAPARQLFALRGFLGTYWKRVLPVLCNEMFWSLSIVALNMVFGRMGSDNYAALTVVRTIENGADGRADDRKHRVRVLRGHLLGVQHPRGQGHRRGRPARRKAERAPVFVAGAGVRRGARRARGGAARAGAEPVRHFGGSAAHGGGHAAVLRGGRDHPQHPVPVRRGHLPRRRGHAHRPDRRRGGELWARAAGGGGVRAGAGRAVPLDVCHHARGG